MDFGRPRRLEWISEKFEPPLYFVTFCTTERRTLLANESVHCAVIQYGKRGGERRVALGR